ncbi:hypothetical protein FRC18_006291 [Serendipita sp. 400]|nr:hypothetical protein FRC18_006291 [Serendipita sp. 400]
MTQAAVIQHPSPFFDVTVLPRGVPGVIESLKALSSLESADIEDKDIREITDQLQKKVASYSGIAKPSLDIAKRGIEALDQIRVLESDLRGNIRNISDEEIRDTSAIITKSMSGMYGEIQNVKENVGNYRFDIIKIRNQIHDKSQFFAEQRKNETNGKCRAEENACMSMLIGDGATELIRVGADVSQRQGSTIYSPNLPWVALGMLATAKIAQIACWGYYFGKAHRSEKEIQRYNSLIATSNAIMVHVQAFELHLDHIAYGWAELESEWELAIGHLKLTGSATDKLDRKGVRFTMGQFHTKIERIYGSLMTYKQSMTKLVDHFSRCNMQSETNGHGQAGVLTNQGRE